MILGTTCLFIIILLMKIFRRNICVNSHTFLYKLLKIQYNLFPYICLLCLYIFLYSLPIPTFPIPWPHHTPFYTVIWFSHSAVVASIHSTPNFLNSCLPRYLFALYPVCSTSPTSWFPHFPKSLLEWQPAWLVVLWLGVFHSQWCKSQFIPSLPSVKDWLRLGHHLPILSASCWLIIIMKDNKNYRNCCSKERVMNNDRFCF